METDWAALDGCVETIGPGMHCILKIVVFDEADYAYGRGVASRYPNIKIYVQVGNPAPLHAINKVMPEAADIDDLMERFRWLAGRIVADRWFDATVLPQLHVLAWGNKRGV